MKPESGRCFKPDVPWNRLSAGLWASSPVWDGQASIHGSLQSTEHLVACGGSGEPSIQVAGESSWLTINALHVELIPGHLHLALIHLIQAKLVQELRNKSFYMTLF